MSQSAQSYAGAAIVLFGLLSVSGRTTASNDSLVGSGPIISISPAKPVMADPNGAAPRIESSEIIPATGTDLLDAPISSYLTNEDAAIAGKLRELVATALAQHVYDEGRSAVEAFYRDRGFAPLWIANAAPPRAPKMPLLCCAVLMLMHLIRRITPHRVFRLAPPKPWRRTKSS